MAIRGRIWSPNPRRVNVVWVLTPPKRRGHTSVRHQKSCEQCILHCLGIWNWDKPILCRSPYGSGAAIIVSETWQPIKVTVVIGAMVTEVAGKPRRGKARPWRGDKRPSLRCTAGRNLSSELGINKGWIEWYYMWNQGVTPRIIVWLLLAH